VAGTQIFSVPLSFRARNLLCRHDLCLRCPTICPRLARTVGDRRDGRNSFRNPRRLGCTEGDGPFPTRKVDWQADRE
jgi:hypothetical protein